MKLARPIEESKEATLAIRAKIAEAKAAKIARLARKAAAVEAAPVEETPVAPVVEAAPTKPSFETAFAGFVASLETRLNEYKTRMGYTFFDRYIVATEIGRKYIKLIRVEVKEGSDNYSRSLIGFADKTNGQILKAASWASPAAHARGNVYSDKNGMEAIDASGHVHYLR